MPAPATHDFVHLEISSASVLNTSVNGPLNYLIGRNLGSDDAIELEDSLEVLSGSGGRYLRLPQGTTGQRPTGAAGMLRLNTTTRLVDFHDGTAWDSVLQASLVNFETLNTAGDVGIGGSQLAEGDHVHMYSVGHTSQIRAFSRNAQFNDAGPAFVLDPGVWLFLIAVMGFSNANTLTIRVIDENDFDAVIVAFPVYDLNGVPEGHLITVTVPSGASLQLQYMPSAQNRSFANEALAFLAVKIDTS